jgi:hypothetical protein
MERLSVGIEFLAFSAMVLHFPWSRCPRSAVQLLHPEASYQRVVIPAKLVPAGFKPGAGIQASFNAILDSRLRGMTDQHLSEKGNLDKDELKY